MKSRIFLLAVLAVSIGCDKGGTVSTSEPAAPAQTTAAETTPAKPVMPEELKHDGYNFYGLGRSEPLPLEVVQSGQPTRTGTMETELIEVKDGKAYFEQRFTGGLSSDSNSKLMVDKTGVYTSEIRGKALADPQIEIPASVTPGATWKVDKPIELADGLSIEKMSSRAAATETITTPAGKFDCIKVASNIDTKQNGALAKATMTVWYSKGVGPVKMITETVMGKMKTRQVWQATK